MTLFLKILFKDVYHLLRTKESREFLRLALVYGNSPRYQTRTIRFFSYTLQVPDFFSFLWQFNEIFAKEAYRFSTPNPMPVIFDCGANVGTSLLYFKRLYPRAKITAFEADPQIAQILQRNLVNNRITDVDVIAKAVWVNENGIEISQEGADGASIFTTGNRIKIPSVRLKDYLQSQKRIDLLKMDIEGAEYDVLNDCRANLSSVENLFIEYHAYVGYEQKLDEILAILRENKFRYFIKGEADRKMPFVNRTNKSNPAMDLQLNIFAYRTS